MCFRNWYKQSFNQKTPSRIIIDTHGGLQDILAIIFAHRYILNTKSDQEIIGITCVAGKNSLDDAVRSALIANKILGTKIPVFRGQSQSLILRKDYPKVYADQRFTHLEKKLYSQLEQDQNIYGLVQNEKAVDFISRSLQQHKHNIGIIAFGPVTNLGLAHKLEGSFKYASLIGLTGGQYFGMGNTVQGHIEANFAYDPLAVHILFKAYQNGEHLKNKIYINPLEHALTFCFKQAINVCLDSGKINKAIDQILVNMMGINSIVLNCGPILSIIPLLNPKAITNVYHVFAQVVRDGDQLDGLLAINWIKSNEDKHLYENYLYLYEGFDKPSVNQMLIQAFTQQQSTKNNSGNIQP